MLSIERQGPSTYVEVDILAKLSKCIHHTRHINDNPFHLRHLLHNQVRQQKVAQMIRSELSLVALLADAVVLEGPDSGIVYEDVDVVNGGIDLSRGFANRGEGEEIQANECCLDVRIHFVDFFDDGLDFGLASAG